MAAFLTDCILRVVSDAGARPEFVVVRPLVFSSDAHGEVVVPAGTTTDGPSIPVLAVPLVGGTPGLRAAVVHDYLVRSRTVPRGTADDIFREALCVCGVDPAVAEAMYAAVRVYSRSREPRVGDVDPIYLG